MHLSKSGEKDKYLVGIHPITAKNTGQGYQREHMFSRELLT